MNDPINPNFLGQPDKINLDFDNQAEGPHTDIIHRLSATDTLKTRVGLNGQIINQEVLQNNLTPNPPPAPDVLKYFDN